MAAVAVFNDPRQEILTRFWSRTDSRPICLTDLVFKCSDGPVEAHRALLKSSCDVLAQALQNAQACHEDPVTVLVPEFSASTVRKFLELFYTGCVQVSADGDIDAITNFGVGHLGFRFNLTGDEKSEQSASVSGNLEGVGTFQTAASVSSNPEGSSINEKSAAADEQVSAPEPRVQPESSSAKAKKRLRPFYLAPKIRMTKPNKLNKVQTLAENSPGTAAARSTCKSNSELTLSPDSQVDHLPEVAEPTEISPGAEEHLASQSGELSSALLSKAKLKYKPKPKRFKLAALESGERTTSVESRDGTTTTEQHQPASGEVLTVKQEPLPNPQRSGQVNENSPSSSSPPSSPSLPLSPPPSSSPASQERSPSKNLTPDTAGQQPLVPRGCNVQQILDRLSSTEGTKPAPETDVAEPEGELGGVGVEPVTSKVKTFSCALCRKTFKRIASVKIHLKRVHKALTFPIPTTSTSSQSSRKTTRTSQKENSDVGKPSIHCIVCRKSIKNKSVMRKHLRKVHNLKDSLKIFT